MSFNCRIFGHRGIRQMHQTNPNQFSSNGPWMLTQPYEWSQTIQTNGATAVSTAAIPNDAATLIRIEVPDNQTIRYEINMPARPGGAVAAGANSASLSGKDQFDWSAGATVSIVEAASFP
jgi:hypothetical protein